MTRGRRLERRREPTTGQVVLAGRTRQGMEVAIAPLPGRARTYAVLAARYGSVDTRLPDGTELPDGIAHFLEHKMFETADGGDLFDVYGDRGASANAYTTSTYTAYLFSCTRGLARNLDTLVASVQSLHVDAESVEREKAIIGQEIAMYDDDPGWRGYLGLLQALYRRHPVRIDIAGTTKTVAAIDEDLLRRTHAAYYHPRNLVLVVAGDVEASAVLDRAEAALGDAPRGRRHRRPLVPEPARVARRQQTATLSISRPHVLLGLKERGPGGGKHLVRRQVVTALVLDALFGDGGRIEAPLYREGVVDESFHATYEAEPDHAHAVISAEVDEAAYFQRRLLRALAAAAEEGLSPAEVDRARRRLLGRHLRTFNTAEGVAHHVLGTTLAGVELGSAVANLRAVDARAATRRLRQLAAAPSAWSVLTPRREP